MRGTHITPPSKDSRPVPPRDDRSAVRQTLRALNEGGWFITRLEYSDGEVYEGDLRRLDKDDILYEIMAVDDIFVHVTQAGTNDTGWLYFVFGNDPEEVIANSTLSVDEVLRPLTQRWCGF